MQTPVHLQQVQDPLELSLQQMTASLIHGIQQTASRRKSFFFNRIRKKITLDRQKYFRLQQVLKELLYAIVSNSDEGKIVLTVVAYRDSFTLHIQERNNNNGYALAYKVGALQPDLAQLGGSLTIDNARQKITTISLHMPLKAA